MKKTTLLFMYLFTLGLKITYGQISKKPKIPTDAKDVSYDIILVAGQSNTHYGYPLDKEIDSVSSRLYTLRRFDGQDYRIAPAKQALDFWTKADDKISFVNTFSNLYINDILKNSKRKVLVIPCGYSESSILSWTKKQILYEDAIQRVNYVLQNVPGSKLTTILWHQGESNIDMKDYDKVLDKMIIDMRADIDQKNMQEVPFILGGMVPYWTNLNGDRKKLQQIIKNTVERVPKTGYADSEFPTVIEKTNNNFDITHFDAAGQREMGIRYYKEFLRTTGQNVTKIQDLITVKKIPNLEDEKQKVLIHPNPATDIITISAQTKIKNVAIYNQSGQLVFQNRYDQNEVTIAVHQLLTGIHIVSITLENDVIEEKKIILK